MKPSAANADLIAFLAGVSRRLQDAYAACVTAEIALSAQNADHDAEIARSLRAGVSEAIAAELQWLRRAARRLDVRKSKRRAVAIAPSGDPEP